MEPRWPSVRCLVPAEEAEVAADVLWSAGATGIEERDGGSASAVELQAGFPTEEAAHAAVAAIGERWPASVDVVTGDEWMDVWREDFEPFTVGRVVVVPAWRDPSAVVVALDPGRAFGTGAHPSTALVLSVLQGLRLDGAEVLDVGCGSGVLAVTAALLGARRVVAVDIEDEAARVTAENAARNGVAAVVEASTTPVGDVQGTFGVVLANILAPVLIDLAPAIAARVAPGGTLVLSGLLDTQADRVTAAYAPEGLSPIAREPRDPWVALVLRRD